MEERPPIKIVFTERFKPILMPIEYQIFLNDIIGDDNAEEKEKDN